VVGAGYAAGARRWLNHLVDQYALYLIAYLAVSAAVSFVFAHRMLGARRGSRGSGRDGYGEDDDGEDDADAPGLHKSWRDVLRWAIQFVGTVTVWNSSCSGTASLLLVGSTHAAAFAPAVLRAREARRVAAPVADRNAGGVPYMSAADMELECQRTTAAEMAKLDAK